MVAKQGCESMSRTRFRIRLVPSRDTEQVAGKKRAGHHLALGPGAGTAIHPSSQLSRHFGLPDFSKSMVEEIADLFRVELAVH